MAAVIEKGVWPSNFILGSIKLRLKGLRVKKKKRILFLWVVGLVGAGILVAYTKTPAIYFFLFMMMTLGGAVAYLRTPDNAVRIWMVHTAAWTWVDVLKGRCDSDLDEKRTSALMGIRIYGLLLIVSMMPVVFLIVENRLHHRLWDFGGGDGSVFLVSGCLMLFYLLFVAFEAIGLIIIIARKRRGQKVIRQG